MNEIVITAKSDLGSGGFRRKVVTSELDIMRYATETPLLEILDILKFPDDMTIRRVEVLRSDSVRPNFICGDDVVLVNAILNIDGSENKANVELMIELA